MLRLWNSGLDYIKQDFRMTQTLRTALTVVGLVTRITGPYQYDCFNTNITSIVALHATLHKENQVCNC